MAHVVGDIGVYVALFARIPLHSAPRSLVARGSISFSPGGFYNPGVELNERVLCLNRTHVGRYASREERAGNFSQLIRLFFFYRLRHAPSIRAGGLERARCRGAARAKPCNSGVAHWNGIFGRGFCQYVSKIRGFIRIPMA